MQTARCRKSERRCTRRRVCHVSSPPFGCRCGPQAPPRLAPPTEQLTNCYLFAALCAEPSMCRAAADCELPLAANPPYMHAYRARPRAFEPARAKYGALPSRVSDNERRIATRITPLPFHRADRGRAHGVPGPRTPGVHAPWHAQWPAMCMSITVGQPPSNFEFDSLNSSKSMCAQHSQQSRVCWPAPASYITRLERARTPRIEPHGRRAAPHIAVGT